MGIRDVLDSTVNGVKTPITYAWQSSYGLGSVAVTKINNAVRGGGNGVNNNDENKQLIMKKETNNEEFKPSSSSSSSSSSGSPDHQVVVIVGQEKIGGGERQMGGFRDVLGSAASVVGGVKTPVSNALKNSHSLGSAAVSKIDNTVRVGGGNGVEKLKEYMPGPEGQEKIGRALTHPATKELFKLVVPPGGVGVYNVVAAVLKNQSSTNAHDNKKYEQVMEQLKLLRDENDKMRADLEHIKGGGRKCFYDEGS